MSDGFIIKRGGGGGDGNAAFKALVDRSITEVTADMLQGITSISNYAFYKCPSLTSVTIPNVVTSIGKYFLSQCTSLVSAEIPDSVTSIGDDAFEDSYNLRNVKLSNNITVIKSGSFGGCNSLQRLTIPSKVTEIEEYCFSYVIGEELTVEAISPPVLQDDGLFLYGGPSCIYVPAESVEAYKSANIWSEHASIIQAIPSEGD